MWEATCGGRYERVTVLHIERGAKAGNQSRTALHFRSRYSGPRGQGKEGRALTGGRCRGRLLLCFASTSTSWSRPSAGGHASPTAHTLLHIL